MVLRLRIKGTLREHRIYDLKNEPDLYGNKSFWMTIG